MNRLLLTITGLAFTSSLLAQVGIGTSTPTQALDIEATSAAIDLNSTTGGPVFNLQLAGTTTFSLGIDNADSDKFKIGISSISTGTAITINSSSQVGVNTTTPTANLDVDGSAIFNESGAAVDFRVEGDTEQNLLFIQGSSDNIGIGNSSPSEKLHVTGNIVVENGTTNAGTILLLENSTNGSNSVSLLAPSAITADYSFILPDGAGTVGQILSTDGSGNLSWTAAGAGDLLSTNNLSDLANASTSRTNLGLAIGTDVQAYDAQLDDIAGLTPTDGNIVIGNGTNFILENGATARTSLGLAIGTDVQAYDAQLDDVAGLTPTDGNIVIGDGANFILESGATARTSLGLSIGTDVQASDAQLDDIAGLTPTDGNIVIGDGANFILESGATARTSLGLAIGTDVQAYDADLDDLATGVFNEAGADVDFRIEGVTDTEVFFVDASTDRVGISTIAPGYTLDVAGDINYSGTLTNVSDKRYKKDIHKINDALSLINQFDGYTYKYRKEEFPKLKFDTTLQIGFIAQELNKVLPELVSQNDSGYYSVDYVKVTPVLLMAVKEQQKIINTMQLEIEALKKANTALVIDETAQVEMEARLKKLESIILNLGETASK